MKEQMKEPIILEIISASSKNIVDTVKQSLKRALPLEFLEKTTDEKVKLLISAGIPEFKAKGNKIGFEASNEILEKINQAISSIEKSNVEKCQQM